MSDTRNWGSTVMGWFIVREEGSEPAPGEVPAPAAVPQAATPEAAAPGPNVFRSEPPAAPGGQVDYAGVFDAAGIDAEERERVEKARQLLASLPSETPVAVRKQIVEASLKAFGVPIDKIIETGVRRSRRSRATSAQAAQTPRSCSTSRRAASSTTRRKSGTSAP